MNTVLNRKGAIEYTEKWYDSHNPDYVNYDEGEYQVDCTNFVSQCWHNFAQRFVQNPIIF